LAPHSWPVLLRSCRGVPVHSFTLCYLYNSWFVDTHYQNSALYSVRAFLSLSFSTALNLCAPVTPTCWPIIQPSNHPLMPLDSYPRSWRNAYCRTLNTCSLLFIHTVSTPSSCVVALHFVDTIPAPRRRDIATRYFTAPQLHRCACAHTALLPTPSSPRCHTVTPHARTHTLTFCALSTALSVTHGRIISRSCHSRRGLCSCRGPRRMADLWTAPGISKRQSWTV